MPNQNKNGIIFALSAYSLWAFAPIYFKWISDVPAMEILAHRVIWSLLLSLLIILFTKRWQPLMAALRTPKTVAMLILSTLLIGANWGVFIWAVNDNRLLSASLGYYINPLMNILLGMMFFSERLDVTKKIAAGLCVAAVLFEIIQFGQLPWVAVALATSFALYGFVRKKLGIDSFIGMGLETGFLLPIAVIYLFLAPNVSVNIFDNDWSTLFKLMLAGPVTMVPLLLFAAAANRISLTNLGFFQYIGPSGMFLLAIFIYNEPLSQTKLITFLIIWGALALLVWDNLRQSLKRRTQKKSLSNP